MAFAVGTWYAARPHYGIGGISICHRDNSRRQSRKRKTLRQLVGVLRLDGKVIDGRLSESERLSSNRADEARLWRLMTIADRPIKHGLNIFLKICVSSQRLYSSRIAESIIRYVSMAISYMTACRYIFYSKYALCTPTQHAFDGRYRNKHYKKIMPYGVAIRQRHGMKAWDIMKSLSDKASSRW